MVYKKLLLSEGGGIISPFQQVEQSHNTINILIGLGGMGVECIRSIKTQVHMRIKPDGGGEINSYSHIRFLGVDSDAHSSGKYEYGIRRSETLPLDDNEFVFIGAKQVPIPLLKNPELTWFNYENINIPPHLVGAGGIRQVGRLLMMERSQFFINKVENEIKFAKRRTDNPKINLYIFAGLCGGTGSGSFLDVCYMLRSLSEHFEGVTISGYFFLPDVILSKVPFTDLNARRFISSNGYAAMQELDYCMALPKNGGSFEQEYQEKRKISWNLPPVDICHVISSMDVNGHIHGSGDGYGWGNILDATTEHIMQLLENSWSIADFPGGFDLINSYKKIGAQISYSSIGGVCAYVPLREINTYLASELFSKFSVIQRNAPNQADVERLAISSIARDAQSINMMYDSLYRRISKGTCNEPKNLAGLPGLPPSIAELEQLYAHHTGAMCKILDNNADSMVSESNMDSLISRIQEQLMVILRDIYRGPMFAYRILSSSEPHNLQNVIEGLIVENQARWHQEAAQADLRYGDYENAKNDFCNRRRRSLLDNDSKRFKDCEFYLMLLEKHKLNMYVFSKLDFVLIKFRNQIVKIAASYYNKLNRVMETLFNTFDENRYILKSNKSMKNNRPFAIPLLSIVEIKNSLDTTIARINIPMMLDALMVFFVQNEDEWIQEDENKIVKLITDFFVNTAFINYANKTITSYLKEKYEDKFGMKITDMQLAEFVYKDVLTPLTEIASPFFCFNNDIWSENKTIKNRKIAFPSNSLPIKAAVEALNNNNGFWRLEESAFADRIYIMCSTCGFPLCSYINCNDYESLFISSREPGRHYYEGKTFSGICLNDWNKLPSITPQSVIDVAHVPEDLALRIRESNYLYKRALNTGVLDDEGNFYKADEGYISRLISVCDDCENIINKAGSKQEKSLLCQKVETLKALLSIPMIRIKKVLPSDGVRLSQEVILAVQKDYFFASPALHAQVQEEVELIEQIVGRADSIMKMLKK